MLVNSLEGSYFILIALPHPDGYNHNTNPLIGNNETVKNQRPKNLNLLTIHFPIPAIVSILHRVSGVVLFLLIPLSLWVFSLSLESEQRFEAIKHSIGNPVIKCIILAILAAFFFHFMAGLRHLFMDIHIGEELKSGRRSAMAAILITLILTIVAGVWLW
jgi:succinate dehydrogenase / fumarate reductase, cytochrome b subunit